MNLDDDEKKLIENFRKLNQSQKKAILASQQSFKNWLQTSLSSIWNKVSSFFNDVWDWFRSSVNPKGKFNKVWVDHNTEQNNVMGMKIHAEFEVSHLKDVPCRAAAYFYFSSGNKLKDSNNAYNTKDGQVCVGKDFNPSYEESIYRDFELFMPYSELHMSDGKHSLKFYISLYVEEDANFFADSNWVHFTYSSG